MYFIVLLFFSLRSPLIFLLPLSITSFTKSLSSNELISSLTCRMNYSELEWIINGLRIKITDTDFTAMPFQKLKFNVSDIYPALENVNSIGQEIIFGKNVFKSGAHAVWSICILYGYVSELSCATWQNISQWHRLGEALIRNEMWDRNLISD